MARAAALLSKAIPSRTNRKVLAAEDHAYRIGHPLNCFVTVHWEWTRFANRDRYTALQKLREAERHWLTYRGLPFLDIAVRENPPQGGARPTNGEHVHQALHVPPSFWEGFCEHCQAYLSLSDESGLKIKPIYDRNLVRRYFMKGGTTAVRRANGVPDTPNCSPQQGTVAGKRVTISQSLTFKALSADLGLEVAKEQLAPKAARRQTPLPSSRSAGKP